MTSAAAKERVEVYLRREPTWVHRYVSVCHCEISCSKGLFITRVKSVYTFPTGYGSNAFAMKVAAEKGENGKRR
jgi:hypothetical protein